MLGRTDNSNKKSGRKGVGNQKNVSAAEATASVSASSDRTRQTSTFDAVGCALHLRTAWEKSSTTAKKIVTEKTPLPSFNFVEALRISHQKYISSTTPASTSLSSSSSAQQQEEEVKLTDKEEGSSGAEEEGGEIEEGAVVIDILDDTNLDGDTNLNTAADNADSTGKKSKKKKKKKKTKSKANEGTLTMEGGVLKFTPAAQQEDTESSSVQEYEKIPKECISYLVGRYEKQQSQSSSKSSRSVPIKWVVAEAMMKIVKDMTDKDQKKVPFMTIKSNTRGPRNVCAVLPHPTPYDSVKLCGNCNKVSYCSKDCQQLHWNSHKYSCKPDSLADSRKASAEERYHNTAAIRRLLYPHWQAKFGKGVILMMCRDVYPYDDDEAARNIYMTYVTMNDIKSESSPFSSSSSSSSSSSPSSSSSLRAHHTELMKLSSATEPGNVTIVTAAIDQSGYITSFSEKIQKTQLEVCKSVAGKEEDIARADMVSVPVLPLEPPVLYLFQ